MTFESWLRVAGAAALLAAGGIGGRHRLRAHRVGGAVSRRAEGVALMVGLRMCAALWALGIVSWLAAPALVRWTQLSLADGWRILGALLLLAAVPLYGWVFRHLGLNVTDTVVVRERATLVRTGPYRWVRHPLYSFGVPVLAGWFLLTASVWVLAAGLAAAWLLVRRTAIEERHLLVRFGDEYRAYMAETGRFLPRFRGRRPAVTIPIVALAAVLTAAAAAAQEDAGRPLSTDRPDRTESAYSVPRGRWQLELDLVSHGWHEIENSGAGGFSPVSIEALDLAPFNLKYGIAGHADLQLLVAPWSRTRVEVDGVRHFDDEGAGDVTGRLKLNLYGNDGGRTALALMPFVSVPTRGTERRRIGSYGMVTPFALDLGGDRALGAMLVVEKERGFDAWLGGSLTVSAPLRGDLGGFVELYAVRAGFDDGAPSDATLDAGLTYGLGPDLQLDAGVYRGLSDTTEDWRVFVGLAVRR